MTGAGNFSPRAERVFRLTLVLLPLGLLVWLSGWLYRFRPSLINDEYAAIDYFYRAVEGGGFFATPSKIQKPFSVLLGFFSWLFESPLGFEAATAVFAALLLLFFCLIVKRLCGPWLAVGAGLALALHPDLMYYSATGSTVITFAALAMIAIYAAMRREERPGFLWVFAGALLAGGLFRPESWLFAAPAIYWWWPGRHNPRGWLKLGLALFLIGLGPVIWFGQDLLIQGSLFHSFQVALRDKAVGTGAPFSMFQALKFFPVRISERVSWPVMLFGVLGLVMFIRSQGLRKGLLHPLTVFPVLVSAYLALIVKGGVYPVQRYWFFHGVMALIFSAFLLKLIFERPEFATATMPKKALWFAALLPALALVAVRPESSPPDGLWLLLAAGLAALVLAASLLFAREIFSRAELLGSALAGVVVFAFLSYPAFGLGLYGRQISELELESKKQREMIETANFLRGRIKEGAAARILIPARRSQQLNWLFRDRERPETVTFRELFYLYWVCENPRQSPVPVTDERRAFCAEMNRISPAAFRLLAVRPDWIVYLPDDYQFWGPERFFKWLETTDRIIHRNTENPAETAEFELVFNTDLIRVFRVAYSEAYPPPEPLPSLP